jgi:hypothetical protein
MRTPADYSKPYHRLTIALLLCAAVSMQTLSLRAQPFAAQPAEQMDHTPRTLTGTVTDPHHEPLKGAIVKLQVGDSTAISTYITGPDGRYVFKRLDGNTDYKVWVTFRERTSKSREISKFNSNMDTVIDFSVEPF